MKITAIPTARLLVMLRDTESTLGEDSIEARIIRREILRREAPPPAAQADEQPAGGDANAS